VDTPRPSPRTNWTRRVPHPVLIGHAASLASLRPRPFTHPSKSARAAGRLRRRGCPRLAIDARHHHLSRAAEPGSGPPPYQGRGPGASRSSLSQHDLSQPASASRSRSSFSQHDLSQPASASRSRSSFSQPALTARTRARRGGSCCRPPRRPPEVGTRGSWRPGVEDAACPISTGWRTRRVRLVRGGGRGVSD
jgi:hypothetical protein